MGTDDIGFYEGIGTEDGTVDVGFGGEVDDGIKVFFHQEFFDQRLVTDIAMDKTEVWVVFDRFQVCQIPGICEGVEHDYPVLGVIFHPVVDKIAADKSGTAGD